jgi:RNA polymerase sigma-70 factor, ECF subfamily
MAMDDATIMQQVQDGDFDSFEILVERYRPPLLRVAHSKLGDAAWAEDVTQEAFLAVFAARHTYNPKFAFRTWLWTILLNLCRRQLKQRRRQPRQTPNSQLSTEGEHGLGVEPVEWETGLSRLLRVERREQLLSLLNELPEPQGDALRLRFFGELKFAEIAEAMNSSVSGAKRRVENGLYALAERLRQDHETRRMPISGTQQEGEPK